MLVLGVDRRAFRTHWTLEDGVMDFLHPLLTLLLLAAGDQTPQKPPELFFDDSLVVTATSREQSVADLARGAEVTTSDGLRLENQARTLPEALGEVPGVMVQKTAHGQGSPYLRGFTGFRTVMLIDGVRLNNSVLRDGPNQYWATVDPLAAERLEVVKGPASVLYGSDAVGGTVQLLTPDPLGRLTPDRLTQDRLTQDRVSGQLLGRWASAEHSRVGRLDLAIPLGDRLAASVGGSLKDFGDLTAGGDVGEQPHTGYDQSDFEAQLRWAPGARTVTRSSFQDHRTDDAWRTHRTIFGVPFEGTTVGNEQRRVLDQERSLARLGIEHQPASGWVDELAVTLSWHRQAEDRDRVRNDGRQDLRGFEVDTWGLRLELDKDLGRHQLTWGLDHYDDTVDSFDRRFDAAGNLSRVGIQGPVADDASYRLTGLWLQDQVVFGPWRLVAGARWTEAAADAQRVVDPQTGEAIALEDEWGGLVGSLRMLRDFDGGKHQVFGGLAQAFRAPNLSDLTRLDSARSNEIETPSPGLDSERFLTTELGYRHWSRRGSLELVVHHTTIDGAIVRLPTGRVIDGDLEVTKDNVGDGESWGIEIQGRLDLGRGWTVRADTAWLDGELDASPGPGQPLVREPLDRLMPWTSHLALGWRGAKLWGDALVTLAGDADRLSTRDAGDRQRIPKGGTPGYELLTLRTGWDFSPRLRFAAAVENLFDEAYRVHGSGITAAGRNLVLSAQVSF